MADAQFVVGGGGSISRKDKRVRRTGEKVGKLYEEWQWTESRGSERRRKDFRKVHEETGGGGKKGERKEGQKRIKNMEIEGVVESELYGYPE